MQCMIILLLCLIPEMNDLMDMEDLVDDFVTFYVAGTRNNPCSALIFNPILIPFILYARR